MKTTIELSLLLLVTAAHAGPRTSANYTVLTDTADSGGGRTTSASYTNVGSAGAITGLSTVVAPAEIDKAGYLAQLADPVDLIITAPAVTVTEASTLQLGAVLTLDDSSTVFLPANNVSWGVAMAPVTGISSGGLLTTGVVYQDSSASAQGNYSGLTNSIALTVINTLPDNYGTYAGDGLPDDWQVLYLGLGNPNAAPSADADYDSYNNLFEYNSQLIPTNPLSTFSITVVNIPIGGHGVTFSPRQPGSTYDLQGSSDLIHWDPVLGTITDSGRIRTISDPLGNLPRRFYRIGVHRP